VDNVFVERLWRSVCVFRPIVTTHFVLS
jgi:hypothetical protein